MKLLKTLALVLGLAAGPTVAFASGTHAVSGEDCCPCCPWCPGT